MNSDPDDYVISELSDTRFRFTRLTLTFFDRMFDVFTFGTNNKSTLSAIRDKEGNLSTKLIKVSKEIPGAMAFRLIGQMTEPTRKKG